jgi:DNA-directed RNA polymerase specialized sigma24 family protein
MKNKENKNFEEINKRLDLIIGLLLRLLTKDNKRSPFKEQISILHDFGIRPKEIAKILNWDIRNVGKYLSELKRSQRKQVKQQEENEEK